MRQTHNVTQVRSLRYLHCFWWWVNMFFVFVGTTESLASSNNDDDVIISNNNRKNETSHDFRAALTSEQMAEVVCEAERLREKTARQTHLPNELLDRFKQHSREVR